MTDLEKQAVACDVVAEAKNILGTMQDRTNEDVIFHGKLREAIDNQMARLEELAVLP